MCCPGITCILGLSPRIRGKHTMQPENPTDPWSIPAHTGQTRSRISGSLLHEVYPRAYGANPRGSRSMRPVRGLSPRIRGKQSTPWRARWTTGSIPAHTGQTVLPWCRLSNSWVYPRAYGANAVAPLRHFVSKGLSPRIRGKPTRDRRSQRRSRSIPAHTGQTAPQPAGRSGAKVYPRAYGANGDSD